MKKPHNSRITIIFLIFLFLYGILILNLYVIQIKNNIFFNNLAKQQYQISITTKATRAEILDRKNKPLAINNEMLSAFIIPRQITDKEKVKKFLAENFPATLTRYEKNISSNFMFIKRKLSKEEIDSIKNSDISDIKLLKEPNRFYINPTLGPVIGATNIDNQGIAGLEYMHNSQLLGTESTHLLCKDARSGHFYFKRETTKAGVQSKPLITTIDSVLQFLVTEELKEAAQKLEAKEGAILIMNPENGDILAMANYPDFDPNSSESIDSEKTKNHIVANAYELGSVIKIFLALAALEEDAVSVDELINCENKKNTILNGIEFNTTKAHGILTFSEVIECSNNIGVAKVALKLGHKLYDHYTKLGFTKKIGIFPGENPGFITPPNKWSKASPISLSFGYEISANLLQLAQALSIIANDGYLIPPRIIYSDTPTKKVGPLYKKDTTDKIKEILIKTAQKGTAQKAKIKGYTVMGKTGTARLLTNGIYDATRHVFTFAGIVEKDNYKRIVITFIKETPKRHSLASNTAAPLFEKAAQKLLIHDKIL